MTPGLARVPLLALLAGATVADAQEQRRSRSEIAAYGWAEGGRIGNADPSAVVSAEIAFAQLAREKGQWTAFRTTADKDAVMFVPGIVNAQAWLKKQANPASSVTWSPSRVYMACDGSYAVSMGGAKWPDGRLGNFVTIWRRQGDGRYKWMLDWASAPGGASADAVDEIEGKVADCSAGMRRAGIAGNGVIPGSETRAEEKARRDAFRKQMKLPVVRIADPPPASGSGESADGSLNWRWTTGADGARTLDVTVRYGGATITLVEDRFAAQPS